MITNKLKDTYYLELSINSAASRDQIVKRLLASASEILAGHLEASHKHRRFRLIRHEREKNDKG